MKGSQVNRKLFDNTLWDCESYLMILRAESHITECRESKVAEAPCTVGCRSNEILFNLFSYLTNDLQVSKMKQKLERSEAVVLSQDEEISSLSEHQQQLVDKLMQDLEQMRAEKTQLQVSSDEFILEFISYTFKFN